MTRTEYKDGYLKSDHWATLRRLVLDRDGHRCVLCNRADRLEVHHRVYAPYEENLNDLVTLCCSCHSAHHVRFPAPRKVGFSAEERTAAEEVDGSREPGDDYEEPPIGPEPDDDAPF